MGCDFYISTYLKLYTSKGEFETHIDQRRGWFNSSDKKSQEMQMAPYNYTIYQNGSYIDDHFHDKHNHTVANLIEQLNKKIIDGENNVEEKLITFDEISKIVIFSRTWERT